MDLFIQSLLAKSQLAIAPISGCMHAFCVRSR